MSQEFMDPELISDFIVEAKEHLETIEPNLLELEKAPGNLALLNEIFRPMHSLKGASGFMGLNRINMLAHRAENIMDELRKGAMVVTSEIMDVILSATDGLRQMIDNLEQTGAEGDVAIESTIAQIDAIMNGEIMANPSVDSEAYAPVETEDALDTSLATSVVEEASVGEPSVKDTSVEMPSAVEPQLDAPVFSRRDKNESSQGLSVSDWIVSLDKKPAYALTAFGEGHLKDFIDEASEITENLSTGLLELERNPDADAELVNDLFRYFHNLKGNSGIIGFQELNGVTHEAETLLNRVRHGEMVASHELVDLLLLVVDVMDSLTSCIDAASGRVLPFDTTDVLVQLQQAVAGGPIELPVVLRVVDEESGDDVPNDTQGKADNAPATVSKNVPSVTVHAVGGDRDEDDVDVFYSTVSQQQEIIRVVMAELARDSSQKECVDALFRSTTAIQKASGFMQLKDLSLYAERTAGLVNQGRSSGIDFGLMLDILKQEFSIIDDMVAKELAVLRAEPAVPVVQDPPAEDKTSTAKTEPQPQSTAAATAEPVTSIPAPQKNSAPKVESVAEHKPVASASPTAQATISPAVPVAPKLTTPASAPTTAKSTGTPVASTAGAPSKPADGATEHKASSTIRVDHEKLDHLMNLIGELIINRNRYTMIAKSLEEINSSPEIGVVAQNLTETTYAMARISDELQDTIMKVRMVPVSSVFSRFPRLVRDLSRKSGKEVDLILEGEETELDKSVVEVIGDPLVHLIRNAVDHGVESEEERVAKGKPVKGRVYLRAYHKGNSVAIEIEDDGKGLDPEKLREVAVRKGLMTMEEARQLDDREAKELIFAPGFSSADKITDISGRGVGMDVVRTNIKALKGSINISSEVGKGTRFTLSLPLTLAIIDALMITVAGQTYAIPLDAVSETTKIEAHRLTDIKGRKAVTLRGEVLGMMELAELLNLPRKELPEVLSIVVLHDNDRRLGLVVDRLLERQEIVIKPLGSYLGDVRGISGATIMGDGSVILILDPHEVYMMATSNKSGMSN